MSQMTSEAKKALSTSIRGLRDRLITDLNASIDRTYRMAVTTQSANLDARAKMGRQRLEGWWNSQPDPDRARAETVLRVASTWLNRLVLLRVLEAREEGRRQVLTGSWASKGYKDFRELAPALCKDGSQGMQPLLDMVFGELALDLPGLYGPIDLLPLIPMPPATLRVLIEALDKQVLQSCWTDGLTLGWVYQYWNDPAREALDAKLNSGGKVENHEIASKTQMFTERYMVDWLLQNSVNPLWLAICAKNGWTAEAESTGLLDRLDERKASFRNDRDAGTVSDTALMPLHDREHHWAYTLRQPVPQDAVDTAPDSIRDVRILDPAVGSGHFLVVAFDLLVSLYREEARHRGVVGEPEWTDTAIAERIVSHNLAGIDLDPRAVQIAAASLWLKARLAAPNVRPSRLNLVAANLGLGALSADDRQRLLDAVYNETDLPTKLMGDVVDALANADHLGSLLQVDSAVRDAVFAQGGDANADGGSQILMLAARKGLTAEEAVSHVHSLLQQFLAKHTGTADLGLRLHGEQLAAGVRFVELVREGTWDVVVGNPPYQGTSKMKDSTYIAKTYPKGKADLYAAFLERGLQLARPGGTSALLTMRNWMFIKQYAKIREWLLETYDLRALGDFDRGAFEEVPDEVVSVVVSIFRRHEPTNVNSIAQQPTDRDDRTRDSDRTQRKRAATLAGVGQYTFDVQALRVVPEWPVVYWWDAAVLADFANVLPIGSLADITAGAQTSPKDRYLRNPWEVFDADILKALVVDDWNDELAQKSMRSFVPYVDGANGSIWVEPMRSVVSWKSAGLVLKEMHLFKTGTVTKRVAGESFFFRPGVVANALGAQFNARLIRYRGVTGTMATTCYVKPSSLLDGMLAVLNSSYARYVLEGLNPTIHFNVGDVIRLPFRVESEAVQLVDRIRSAFTIHESHREPSVEYTHPGPSPWTYAQDWAQTAVDRDEGTPLPPYEPVFDTEPPEDHLFHGLGVALGRFGRDKQGILDPKTADLSHALPHGILFLNGATGADSLDHSATEPLHAAWASHGGGMRAQTLRAWLQKDAFELHRKRYEGKPIHWPLSSAKKTFVAYVTIHRMNADTLRHLLAQHLKPLRITLDGQRSDVLSTLDSGDTSAKAAANKRYGNLSNWLDELDTFIAHVSNTAENGPPPTTAKVPDRDQSARYDPNLDDGVMINSAALWVLLEPQWKYPKKWWTELATAKGRKDYDWSHLAAKYWPKRVDDKCQKDPSLAVAHGCFWKYHPERAYKWELRLQDEIEAGFTIDEEGSDAARTAWLEENAETADELRQGEWKRRVRKAKKDGGVATPVPGVSVDGELL